MDPMTDQIVGVGQLHFDIRVADLDEAEAKALAQVRPG
jgi:hypothetical protein